MGNIRGLKLRIKQAFVVLGLLLMTFSVFGQKQRQIQKDYDRQRLEIIKEGWDIVPFPGEYPLLNVSAGETNWGKTLLSSPEIVARMKAECKNPVVVKVFDTSGKTNHSSLQTGQLPGANYTGQGGLDDVHGHGTHCLGIIAAKDFGIAYPLVEIGLVKTKPVKILADNGGGDFGWFANAVTAEDVNNKALIASGTFVVVSGSFGGGTAKVSAVETALKSSTESGVVYCIAAGNTGLPGVQYPGNSQYVIAVGSIDDTKKRSSYSTMGPEVWNGMPGRNILSTYLNNSFTAMSGTSMATPFESGLAVIALSKWGKVLSNTNTMKQYLAWVATDLETAGKDDLTGYGLVLVKSVLDKNPKDMGTVTPPPPPPPVTPPIGTPHVERDLYFDIPAEFTMYWKIDGQSASISKISNKQIKASAGLVALTVTNLEVRINKSVLSSDAEYDRVLKNTQAYFTNRGLGLEGGSDYADATYWTAYFYELVVATQMADKLSLDVIRIDCKDQNGKPVTFTFDRLKHWPIQ